MGLDQYAYAMDKELAIYALNNADLTDEIKERMRSNRVDVMQWRKHADLNHWMSQLAVTKGVVNNEGEFNCIPMEITKSDLDALDDHLTEHNGYVEQGRGFFWGQTHIEDIEKDRQFIRSARNLIDEGMTIIYYCWW